MKRKSSQPKKDFFSILDDKLSNIIEEIKQEKQKLVPKKMSDEEFDSQFWPVIRQFEDSLDIIDLR